MDCGEPLALSAILSAAALPPADTGLKVAEIVQLAPAARVASQVFVNEKSSAVLPLKIMELIANGSAPLLVKEIDFDAEVPLTSSLPNARDVALNVTVGTLVVTPVPLKEMDCGEPLALSAMTIEAALPPADTGLKARRIVQLCPGASDVV
jgi:hypothetical protein